MYATTAATTNTSFVTLTVTSATSYAHGLDASMAEFQRVVEQTRRHQARRTRLRHPGPPPYGANRPRLATPPRQVAYRVQARGG